VAIQKTMCKSAYKEIRKFMGLYNLGTKEQISHKLRRLEAFDFAVSWTRGLSRSNAFKLRRLAALDISGSHVAAASVNATQERLTEPDRMSWRFRSGSLAAEASVDAPQEPLSEHDRISFRVWRASNCPRSSSNSNPHRASRPRRLAVTGRFGPDELLRLAALRESTELGRVEAADVGRVDAVEEHGRVEASPLHVWLRLVPAGLKPLIRPQDADLRITAAKCGS
jgi:hypothetical protein